MSIRPLTLSMLSCFLALGCSGSSEDSGNGGLPDGDVGVDGDLPDGQVPDADTNAGVERTVEVRSTAAGWQLFRNGEPYDIEGAGFLGSNENMDLVAAAGANSIRTWSSQDAERILDAAQERNLTVLLGIWLGHAEQGFDYSDPTQVAAQLERARETVERFRDHEALLLWGVGNETELSGDTPEVWDAIEDVARMVKQVDPDHPTVVVTAEIGQANDDRLRDLAEWVDIWGINSFGSVVTLAQRLTDRDWSGPFLITEYGPPGGWEVAQTSWGAPVETHSGNKALGYRAAWSDDIEDDRRFIGRYAFVWGNNPEPLDTWYALLTPSGEPTEPTETLRELWGGPSADNPPPRLSSWSFSADGQRVAPGEFLTARLAAVDDDALSFTWVVHRDVLAPDSDSDAPLRCESEDSGTWTFPAPELPGPYRILGVARDPEGAATMASGRFFVEGTSDYDAALPMRVADHFLPSGWMGDANEGGLTLDPCDRPPDYCSDFCYVFTLERRSLGWSGVIWHWPVGNWDGSQPGVRLVPGATAVEFVAWGDEGGETISFFAGNRDAGEPNARLESLVLSAEPTTYRMPLSPGSSVDVTAGFSWSAVSPAAGASTTFYVRDIRWVSD